MDTRTFAILPSMNPTKIKQILSTQIIQGDWHLEDSPAGKSKTSHIGVLNEKKVFIKLGSTQDALVRLSEIEIAPKVLYSDTHILIQEFIEGTHPTVEWVNENYKILAQVIKKYHSDAKLTALLTQKEAADYDSIFSKFIRELDQWATRADIFQNDGDAQKHLEYLLKNQPTNILESPVPIHADPNLTNFILSQNKLYIVDWDDIRLSDPLRDIGQFLYNFVEEKHWNSFFEEYGFELDTQRKQRIFWWVSALKLFVGLWFYLYQNDANQYKKYLEESIAVREKYL